MKLTTICFTADGKVHNLGDGEYPPSAPHKDGMVKEDKYRVIDAFTCPVEDVILYRKKKKRV